MARKTKATGAVENEAAYIKGVAKNLVDRLYGAAGPPWGTKFSELEDTVAAIRETLTEEMLHQALARQAAQTERPPEYNVCPTCGQPTPGGRPQRKTLFGNRRRRRGLGRTQDPLPAMSAGFFSLKARA
jgi:hypothetical protein